MVTPCLYAMSKRQNGVCWQSLVSGNDFPLGPLALLAPGLDDLQGLNQGVGDGVGDASAVGQEQQRIPVLRGQIEGQQNIIGKGTLKIQFPNPKSLLKQFVYFVLFDKKV